MMRELTDISVIKEICNKYGFKFKKGLGQNFLTERNVIIDTVEGAGIDEETSVIEIGPGFGSLTQVLLQYAKDVTSVEIDNSLIEVLNDLFGDNEKFTLINNDVLKIDLNDIIKNDKTVVVANLPYYITTPIITELLEKKYPLKSITVMVQKEVAARMCAEPGTKDYGALTCLINYYADAHIIRHVKAGCFMPAPKVDSSVVCLKLLDKPRVAPKDEKTYFSVVKAVFLQRRKTLLNTLTNILNMEKSDMEKIIVSAGYDPMVRGEKLSVHDFVKIADKLAEFKNL
ncbi:MAG: 16S rRNA (adenine(1518)-N(6)/adenine(1519)-N(6))-dimethyltransferase RsmA [Clostridia bacterium]|nr:16S rRNA (adenine(1518)-N(6)/adenine(1519)-N(6))-dimethyltransferase RsmA [Clostridia bacterium]